MLNRLKNKGRALKDSKGFTLIEVVIVLAIGALIIMVVLQAVSAAQRNQRDSTRRTEASQISSALESWAANNNGQYPSNAQFTGAFMDNYVPELRDKGWERVNACSATITPTTYEVRYVQGGTQRSYNLWVCLEQGGQTPIQLTN